MNLHEIYMAAQIAENDSEEKYVKKTDMPILISSSEFDNLDTNSYPTGTIFMIWSDSE